MGKVSLSVVQGDITRRMVDAIVNAANESLLGGGGVDGAIHRAAGMGLLDECVALGGCPTGQAKITGGHNLRAKHVIHTVGPVYRGGRQNEEALLRSCYRESLKVAQENGVRTIAFPCISTGACGYPKLAAARIAISTVKSYLAVNPGSVEAVFFVVFNGEDLAIYEKLLVPPVSQGVEIDHEDLCCLQAGG